MEKKELKEELKLSAPWMTFYHQMKAFFAHDPEVKVEFEENTDTIKVYVDNPEKAEALEALLPYSKAFGTVVIYISIIPANKLTSNAALFRTALTGNEAFHYIDSIEGVFTNPLHYVVFKNEVVQYFNDNLADVYGNVSTLYQDIAKDIFENCEGIYFCTDLPDQLEDANMEEEEVEG